MKTGKILSIFTLLFLSIAVIFIACGGGGGGGGGDSIPYTGIKSKATIDETNAVDLALGAYYGVHFGNTIAMVTKTEEDRQISRPRILIVSQALNKCINLVDFTSASSSTLRGVIYEETIYGNCGGSASISINVNVGTGKFTGSYNFDNYCEDGVTISGSTSFSGVIDIDVVDVVKFSYSFDNLSFNDGSDSFMIAGNIFFNYTTYPHTISMNIKLRDGSTGKVYWANNYIMTRAGTNYEVSGRYYDPDYGYVDLYTEETFVFYCDEYWPSEGFLIGEGKTGIAGGSTKTRLTALSTALQVEADTNGDGSYDWDSGVVFSWSGNDLCEVSSYETSLSLGVVYVDGSYAYVALGSEGLEIIDVSHPSSPSLASSYDAVAQDVYVSGSYAYILGSILHIIDVSDPSSPSLAGSYDFDYGGIFRGIYVSGSYAYVATSYELIILDVSDPSSPSFAGLIYTGGNERCVQVSGSYAYVADWQKGLLIIDVSDPSSPSLVGSYPTPGHALSVYVSGSYAYVADEDSGLQIIDVSDPSSPSLAGSYDTPGSAQDVHVSGSYAYVADGDSELQIIDVSDPSSPSLSDSYYDYRGSAQDVYVSGSYVYVSVDRGYRHHLLIVWHNP